MMESEDGEKMPQRNVPTELITHYVVKDYQRMFLAFDEMKQRAEKAEAKVKELQDKHSRYQADRAGLIKQYEKRIDEVREKRAAVVEEMTEELQEQLKNVTRQNKILVQAIADPQKAKLLLQRLEEPTVLSTDEDVDKFEGVKERLDIVLNRLNSILEKTSVVERAIEMRYGGEELKKAMKRFNTAYGKIDSAVLRLNNFFECLGDVVIEKREKEVLSEKEAWRVLNFIREWQQGHFGIVPLQEALNNKFSDYKTPKALKEQIGDCV